MSHKHARILENIYTDPISGNIHWRDVESLIHHLGASVGNARGAKLHVSLNGVEGIIHRPHHGGVCTRQEIKHLRDFLAAAGVTPSLYGGAD